ncbi:MAG: S-layer homology domain-containing protein [Acidimicrobiales bacterium]
MSRARRMLAAVLGATLLTGGFGGPPAAASAPPVATAEADAMLPVLTRFADVPRGRFFSDAVEWAHALGVVTGVTAECFVPDRPATRAEVAAVLQRLLAPDARSTSHPFADVDGAWQQIPVAWMASTGATTGTTPTQFSPDTPATRAMVGTFLWRLAGRPSTGAPTHRFVDVRAEWAQDAVEWMWREGITTGRSTTVFAPDEPVTRAELLTFVWRWQGQPEVGAALVAAEPTNCLVATRTCAAVFSPAVIGELDRLAAGRRVTAAVHDLRTGCTYDLHPGLVITTASVIKAQILAGVLLDAQDRGVPVSVTNRDRIELMMRYSHNSPPTSALYSVVGGAAGMEALDRRFGISGTSHTSVYGATSTTASDRTRLIEKLLIGGGPLDATRVNDAWQWMSSVTPSQTWGLSAGLPTGHAYALKNGFYPLSGRGWRVGTTGVVRSPEGGACAVTILTDLNADQRSGIELVEAVARRVNEALTVGAAAPRGFDALRRAAATSGDTWTSIGNRIGVSSGGVAELRLTNGGEAAPSPASGCVGRPDP